MPSGSNYDVVVRLTTVGTSDLAASMSTAQTRTQAFATELEKTNATVTRMSTVTRGVTADGDKYSVTMKQMADSNKQMASSAEGLSGVMVAAGAAFAGAVAALTAGFALVKKGLEDILKAGLEFDSFMEMNRLALGAMQLTFGQYVDATGNAVDQTQQWSNALGQATETQQLLVKQSLSSAVSIQDLAKTFQMMYGAMLAGGAKTQQEMVTFAGVTADMAAVMGTSYERAARQMTLALLGVTRTTGQLGAMLRSMGIDNATLKSWRDQGIIVEELTARLHAFVEMQPQLQTTWIGITTNMKTAWQQLTGALSGDVFTQLKSDMNDLLHSVMDFSTGKLSQSMLDFTGSLGAGIKGAWDIVVSSVKGSFEIINQSMREHGSTWLDFFQLLGIGMVKLTQTAGDAFLNFTAFLQHPIDSMIDSVAMLMAGIIEMFLKGLGWLTEKIGQGAALIAGATGGAIGGGVSAQAEKDAASLRKLADDWEFVRKNGVAATDLINKGLAANAVAALKAELAIRSIGSKNILDMDAVYGGSGNKYVPTGKETDTSKWDAAIQKYQEFIALAQAKMDTSGLSGLDAALAKNYEAWVREDNAITNAQEAIDKAAKAAGKSAAPYDAFSATLRAMNDDAKKLADTKSFDEYALKFSDALAKMDAVAANDTALDKVEATWKTNLRKITDDYAAAVKALGAEPMVDFWNDDKSRAAAIRYYSNLDALDASHAAAIKRNDEQRALNEKTILDEQSGNWAEYYKDLVQKAVNAGKGIVDAMQSSLKTVADTAYKNASTIGDGVNAALLKIRAELKTEGQIWSDYLTGIWGGITKGLGDALLVLETGTGTIKDALKGILNSLLQSFNQMVVEMVKRWVLGLGQMKDASSGSGGLGSLFAGAGQLSTINAQGEVVYHGGAIDMNSKAPGTQTVRTQQQPGQGTAGAVVGGAVTGFGYGSLVGSASGAPGFSSGAAIGGAVAGIAMASLSTAAIAAIGSAIGLGAAAGSVVPIIGTIIGAIIGGLIAVLSSSNTEAKVYGTSLAPQLKTAGEQIQSSVVDVYAKSLLPNTADFAKSVNGIITHYLATTGAAFKIHAGSTEDITKDIQSLLSGIVPTELLHQLIGQKRTGGQDLPGIDNASKYGGELDPTAPINKMLTDLGFTAAKIGELAGQIDTMAPADWMKMLDGLVGVVASADALGKLLKQTYSETIAGIDAEAAKSPAGKLADRLTGVTDLLKAVSFYTGTEQITKGQEAIAAAQQFYDDAKTAMVQLDAMAKQVTQDVIDETKKVLDTLRTPAELASQSVEDLQHDYERMRFAANPEDLAKAWAQAKTDFEAVAGELVNRVKQIKTLLDDIHTLQDAIATGPGPNAQTDPGAWLAANTAAMEKYRTAMLAATPGSPEEIAAATSMAGLIRDRYTMELDLLGRVKSTIESIDASFKSSIEQLQLQSIGGIDPTTGQWKADAHAQGEFAKQQIEILRGQIAGAKGPEELASLNAEIQRWISFLSSQPQDPAHYAESRQYLIDLSKDIKKQFDDAGKTMTDTINKDIATLGTKLSEAETRMSAALDKVQYDLDALVFHFQSAGTFMTGKLNDWGVEIQNQLNALGPVLADMVKNFTDVNTALTGGVEKPGGTGDKPKPIVPIGNDLTNLGLGANDATAALLAFTAALGEGTPGATGAAPSEAGARAPAATAAPPPANASAAAAPPRTITIPPAQISVNVDVTGSSPDEIASAAASAVYDVVVPFVKKSNTELVRALQNYNVLPSRAGR